MNRTILTCFTCLFLSFTLISCDQKTETKEILRPIRYQQVELTQNNRQRSFSGTAAAGFQSNLSFKVGGTLTKRLVQVGQKIKKGQLIAELDSTDYNIQKQEMQASLAQAEAQVRNSKANYTRTQSLYETDSVAKSDLDAARAQFDSDRASLKALEQKLDLADLKTQYTKLSAPMDGIVGEIFFEVNESVGSGEPVVTIESEGDIKVNVGVPEAYISAIKKGDRVTTVFSSIANRQFSARVSEVSYTLAGATAYPVTVTLEDPSKNIRPGMVANVIFDLDINNTTEKKIIVPTFSVAEDNTGKFVYVVKPAETGVATVHRQAVEIGKVTNQGFEIRKGLTNGDFVVTAGLSKLSDGMRVKFTQ